MRRMLVMAAEETITQVMRKRPLTGSFPAGKGCFTSRIVPSMAARGFLPSRWLSLMVRRRWATASCTGENFSRKEVISIYQKIIRCNCFPHIEEFRDFHKSINKGKYSW